jgi:hypothetical protein
MTSPKNSQLVFRFLVLAILLSGAAPLRAANEVPCEANHALPPGHGTCREPNGTILVGPPPAHKPGVAPILPAYKPGTVVAYPPRTVIEPHPVSSKSTLFTVAGITAIAALITALATLVRAFR